MVLNPSIIINCARENVPAQDGLAKMINHNGPLQQAKGAEDGLRRLRPQRPLLRMLMTPLPKTKRKQITTDELQLQLHLGCVVCSSASKFLIY